MLKISTKYLTITTKIVKMIDFHRCQFFFQNFIKYIRLLSIIRHLNYIKMFISTKIRCQVMLYNFINMNLN